jgi:putative hydrolase of HD superfamily
MYTERLTQQINFIVEIDKLKHIVRQTLVTDGSRRENDAEHSWHIAVMAIILREYVQDDTLDLLRVIQMGLIHDLVEIDAGDTYCYDETARQDQSNREQQAADRIFALLPPDQSTYFRALWMEFEERRTPEARFAAALDRLQPLLHNYLTNGATWKTHGIHSNPVRERNRLIADSAPVLWEYAHHLIQEAVNHGMLMP